MGLKFSASEIALTLVQIRRCNSMRNWILGLALFFAFQIPYSSRAVLLDCMPWSDLSQSRISSVESLLAHQVILSLREGENIIFQTKEVLGAVNEQPEVLICDEGNLPNLKPSEIVMPMFFDGGKVQLAHLLKLNVSTDKMSSSFKSLKTFAPVSMKSFDQDFSSADIEYEILRSHSNHAIVRATLGLQKYQLDIFILFRPLE